MGVTIRFAATSTASGCISGRTCDGQHLSRSLGPVRGDRLGPGPAVQLGGVAAQANRHRCSERRSELDASGSEVPGTRSGADEGAARRDDLDAATTGPPELMWFYWISRDDPGDPPVVSDEETVRRY